MSNTQNLSTEQMREALLDCIAVLERTDHATPKDSKMAKTITKKRAHITKSRSGHYTVTVRASGTWSDGEKVYPFSEVVERHEKLQLHEAQQIVRQPM